MTAKNRILINRAPVLTLWAAVVAERLGHAPDASLTLGKAVAGLTAQSKGRHLGIYSPPETAGGAPAPKSGLGEEMWIELCGRSIPAKRTPAGVRAVVKDAAIDPASVRAYLQKAFGQDLEAAREAMKLLARSLKPRELEERAFGLYEKFRPAIASGEKGWGQKGELDLERIKELIEA